jgi:DNA-binding transcriptional regulator YiaG
MNGFDLEAFAVESSRHIDTDALEAEVYEKMAAKAPRRRVKNVTPPEGIHDRMEAHAESIKAKQSASRKSSRADATAKTTPRPKATKTAAKPKAERKPIERVPAENVIALLDQIGLTRSQLASAMKVSPSLVSEWVGKGRGNLLAKSRWTEVQKVARAAAKGLK